MSRSERVRDATRSARVVSGILCATLGFGLLLWVACWILWICSGRGIGALFVGPFVILSTLSQLCVALLFIAACVMHFADSPHARRCFQVAGILLLLEIPLVIAAFLFEIVSIGR